MKPTPLRAAPAALLVAALLAGCTPASSGETAGAADPTGTPTTGSPATPAAEATPARIIQPGAPGEPSREVTAEEAAAAGKVPHTADDVAFMQGMLPHHAQALLMTSLVGGRTQREDLPLFARRMDISQADEMAQIRRWLETRDESVPQDGPDHGGMAMGDDGLMPGMLTQAELDALMAAEGDAFDRLFIEGMIRHHEGALAMVQGLLDQGGGQETEIFRFVNHVDSDQRIEITRMHQMLAELDAAP